MGHAAWLPGLLTTYVSQASDSSELSYTPELPVLETEKTLLDCDERISFSLALDKYFDN